MNRVETGVPPSHGAMRVSRIILAMAISVLCACSQSASDPQQGVRGKLVKGPVAGATIEVFAITAVGQPSGAALASATTSTSGDFSLPAINGDGPWLLVSRGGSFRDESDQSGQRRLSLAPDQGLESLLLTSSGTATINPYTQALVNKLRRESVGRNFAGLISSARNIFSAAFGFDVLTTIPADPLLPAGTTAQIDYGMALGGAAVAINSIAIGVGLPEPSFEAIQAFSTDLSDGRLDGLVASTAAVAKGLGPVNGMSIPAVDLNLAILRFRQNNIAYGDRPAVIINQTVLAQPAESSEEPQENSAPQGRSDSFGGPAAQALLIAAPGVLENDIDPDGDPITAVPLAGTTLGTLSLNADGSFQYEPGSDEALQDSFSYRVSDGADFSAPVSVSITLSPLPRLSIADAAADEGADVMVFTISLDGSSDTAISVEYSSSNGSALSGSDFVAASGTLSIPAGATSALIEIGLIDDELAEDEEGFLLRLSSPVGLVLVDSEANGTIADDDVLPELLLADARISEGNSGTVPASLQASLSAPAAGPVTVDFITVDGTAQAGADYVARSGTLNLPAGTQSALIVIDLIGEARFEPDESLRVRLSNPVGATLRNTEATLTIANDDGPPVLSIGSASQFEGNSGDTPLSLELTLSAPSDEVVSVSYETVSGTAESSQADFRSRSGSISFTPGEVSQVLDIAIVGDTEVEPDEAFNVRLFDAIGASLGNIFGIGTILNDDSQAANVPPAASPAASFMFSLPAGSIASLSNSELAVDDPDNLASEISYTVNGTLDCGGFVINGVPGTSFTQDDVDSGLVAFDAFNCVGEQSLSATLDIFDGTDPAASPAVLQVTADAPCTPQLDSLLGWYRGDIDGRDILGRNDGALTSGASIVPGRVGNAFSFDGVSGQVTVPDSPTLTLGDQPYSIATWVRFDDVSGSPTIVGHTEGGPAGNQWLLRLNGGNLQFHIYSPSTGPFTMINASWSPAIGQWYHVVVSSDGATVSGYIDGVLVITGSQLGPLTDPAAPLTIGNGENPLAGQVDELELFARALPAAEVAEIWNAGATGRCTEACTTPPAQMTAWFPGDANANEVVGLNHARLESRAFYADGMVGDAFEVAGGLNVVRAPDSPALSPTTAITMDAWVYPTAEGGDGSAVAVFLNKENSSAAATISYEMARRTSVGCGSGSNIAPAGSLLFYLGQSVSGQPNNCDFWVDGGGFLPINEWSHVALSYDGAAARAYVNGVLTREVTGLSGNLFDSSGELTIGGRTDRNAQQNFRGRIDEVEIFDRALAEPELRGIYQAGSFGKCKTGCVEPPDNLIAWYAGDRDADDTAGIAHGQFKNGASTVSGTWQPAVNQDGFAFDGVNDYVDVDDSGSRFGPDEMTVDAWIRRDSFATSDVIASKSNASTGEVSWSFEVNAAGILRFGVSDDGAIANEYSAASQSAVVPLGEFAHVAASFDGAGQTIRLYVDGVEVVANVSGTPASTIFDSAEPLRIGALVDGAGSLQSWFDGIVDELEIFDRALSPGEIASIHAAGAHGKCKPFCGTASDTDLWNFDAGNTVTSNSATLGGSSAESLFGFVGAGAEPKNVLFAIGGAGFEQFIEWQTSTPVSIDRFQFLANHDGAAGNRRNLSRFKLFGYNYATAGFELLYDTRPGVPYGGPASIHNRLRRCAALQPYASDRFRATFVEVFEGPRLLELDGFGSTQDTDRDGLFDNQEAFYGTDPGEADTDMDGASDFDEVNQDGDPNNFNPGAGDTDPLDPGDLPVNMAPVNSVPARAPAAIGGSYALFGLGVSDADAGSSELEVTLSVDGGHTLSVRDDVPGGLVNGDFAGGITSAVSVQFNAPLDRINTTLADSAGVLFNDTGGVSDVATLTISSDDLGSSGGGGAMSDTDMVAIDIHVLQLEFLNGTNGFRVRGANPDDGAGTKIDIGGDVNNDGFADFAVGSPFADPPGRDAGGGVKVVYGGAGIGFGGLIDLEGLGSRSEGFGIRGEAAFDKLASVAILGDVNADGVDDVLLGAAQADGGRGAAYVVFGDGTHPVETSALNGADGFRLDGVASGDGLGQTVGMGGDVNGDGIDDFIVGAESAAANGEAYLFFGDRNIGSAGSIAPGSLNGANGYRLRGASSGDDAGTPARVIRDVDGDGIDDVLIGARSRAVGGIVPGVAYLVFGAQLGALDALDGSSDGLIDLGLLGASGTNSLGVEFRGDADIDRTGAHLHGGGDVNGDGYNDLIIAAPRADVNPTDAGRVYLVYGGTDIGGGDGVVALGSLNGSDGVAFLGLAMNDELGRGVAIRGDVNGDGLDDILLGARSADANGVSNTGESWLIFGGSLGTAGVQDLAELSGLQGLRLPGYIQGEFAGLRTALGGDINGDGLGDMLIGGGSFIGSPQEGAAYAVFGANFSGDPSVLVGGAGDDNAASLPPAAGVQTLAGGLGSDFLDGGAGADRLFGGHGDDTLVFDPADIRVDGGLGGSDGLLIPGSMDFDLPALNAAGANFNRFLNIEIIDSDGNGAPNTLTLDRLDVLRLLGRSGALFIFPDAMDTVTSNEQWTYAGINDQGPGFRFNVYRNGNAELHIFEPFVLSHTGDSDRDGIDDATEIANGTNPLDWDSDDDLLSDGKEDAQGSDPLLANSDADEVPDVFDEAPTTAAGSQCQIFVDNMAAGGSGYLGWSDAVTSIGAGITAAAAASCGEAWRYLLIRGSGTDYFESALDFSALNNTKVIGSLPGDGVNFVPVLPPSTTIDAQFADRIGSIASTNSFELHALRMINGASSSPGGAFACSGGSSNFRISHSEFFGNDSSGIGGALSLLSCSFTELDQLVFLENETASSGGAVAVSSGTLTVRGSSFARNKAFVEGGAIYLFSNAWLKIADSLIASNSATNTAGIRLNSASLEDRIVNNLFLGNHADGNGALTVVSAMSADPVSVTHNSLAYNSWDDPGGSCASGDGAGLHLFSTGTLTDYNVASNIGVFNFCQDNGTASFTADDYFRAGGAPGGVDFNNFLASNGPTGANGISVDPQFVSGFRLFDDGFTRSASIDAGDPSQDSVSAFPLLPMGSTRLDGYPDQGDPDQGVHAMNAAMGSVDGSVLVTDGDYFFEFQLMVGSNPVDAGQAVGVCVGTGTDMAVETVKFDNVSPLDVVPGNPSNCRTGSFQQGLADDLGMSLGPDNSRVRPAYFGRGHRVQLEHPGCISTGNVELRVFVDGAEITPPLSLSYDAAMQPSCF